MRVVVTGGAGFIGANLVRTLLAHPGISQVAVVDDLSAGDRTNLAGVAATLHEGSILDAALLDEAFAGAHAVVHLAALPPASRSAADPLAGHHVNATGTLEVLEAARRVGGVHVVAASSASVHGTERELPERETARAAPRTPHAAAKLAAEAYLGAYHHCYGLGVLPLRFFNVFGPLQPAGPGYPAVVPAFLAAAMAGRPLTVHGDGRQTRDFTYVGTVAQVITEAVVRRVVHPDPVNLGFGSRTSLLELAGELESVLGHRLEVTHTAPRPGDVRDSRADGSRLRELFPTVVPVPLREGLERTSEWFSTL
ncbi:NAD-dependent epimerase/dehydratase family protein [Kitasatospora sp. NBC_00240]|uniref:NAD-dependent epimerase/dehydratase family protein n=1 Tax=Kitasatospora sp. NBC_00240 TaxID=2903567 RepID=UPI002257EEAF|nr:NAD-dependent epimerase/dehydratase family protein [Kitasatospora sp. NBC_00240]MCX5214020.1 NAD-dependent epimerase/dehydratase family protein [Kitasatospora sp. NBC_00240]